MHAMSELDGGHAGETPLERRMRENEARTAKVEARLEGHEDKCGVRYDAIKEQHASVKASVDALNQTSEQRMKRIEMWVIGGAGTMAMALIAFLANLVFSGGQ